MNTNQNDEIMEVEQEALKKHKRTRLVIILSLVGCLLLLLLCTLIPGLFGGEEERETAAPVDPSKLHETKEEGFDIFEYEEYLKYDNTVYYYDPSMSMTVSVDEQALKDQNEGFVLLYDLIHVIMEGDSEAYNDTVAKELRKKNGFTQQQLYDILITKYSVQEKNNGDAVYTEYVFLLEYKIHENNGSFRNTVEPDASRPQYFVINDSTGQLLVMDIIDILPKK